MKEEAAAILVVDNIHNFRFCPVFSSSKLKAERVSGSVVFLATNRLGHSCLCPGVSPRQKIDVIFLALCR